MSRAFALVEKLTALLALREEEAPTEDEEEEEEEDEEEEGDTVTFQFKGFRAAGPAGGGATASTKNTEDQLRAKGLVAGHDYMWQGPFVLKIRQEVLDRDLMDVIQSEGGAVD